MRKLLRYISTVVLILVIAMFLVSLGASLMQTKESSLSEIVQKINSGEATELILENESITAKVGDEYISSPKSPSDSGIEVLTSLGAQQDKISNMKVTVRTPGAMETFFGILLPTLLPFIIIGFIIWLMFRQAQGGSFQALSFGKSRAKLASFDENKRITFKDIAGLTEAKKEISEIVEFLKEPQKFHKLGARIPRGVLLVGSPGTGKTMLAKAVANEADVPFYFVSGSEFVEMFVGVGANRVRDTFEVAKKTAPSIIFIDEIDAVGRHRGAGLGGGHDEREQTLNQILVEMDGFDTNDTVVVVAATNRPDILDPALLRPGRFDRRVILDEPSLADREAILKIHSREKPFAKDVNMRVVAERTPGFSGADLANLVNEAAILAARNDQTEISQDNLFHAIEKVLLGPERRSRIISKKEKEITAYHEAGHALVATAVPHADPVHKVSIISRGRAGGYTMKLPKEEKYLRSKAEFQAEIAVLLAGYAAEKLIFKETTTGASNDLRVASDLARQMITRFGMSDSLGPVTYGEKEELVFLGKELSSHKNYSEQVAFQIDSEIKKLIVSGLNVAKRTLTKKMEILHRIAKELIKKETLEQKEFYALIS